MRVRGFENRSNGEAVSEKGTNGATTLDLRLTVEIHVDETLVNLLRHFRTVC